MKMKSAFAIVMIGFCSTAMAEPYVGGSLGKIDHDLDGFSKGTTIDVHFGNKFGKNFSVEAGYTDFGEASDTISPVWTASGNTLYIVGKAAAPLNERTEIFLQVGFHSYDIELEEAGAGVFFTDDGTDTLFGFGGSLEMNERTDLVVKYTNFELDGDSSTAISFGVDYRL